MMAQCSDGKVESGTMDSLALEQERGITIMAKVTSTSWKGCKINLVDTPGPILTFQPRSSARNTARGSHSSGARAAAQPVSLDTMRDRARARTRCTQGAARADPLARRAGAGARRQGTRTLAGRWSGSCR